ncbi:hypothetical protein USB125703_00451 [Pseudoclavibacter triregionum]|nr:hypothetical protein USB125703_00451 [Pseudoclavibacter triregionum]
MRGMVGAVIEDLRELAGDCSRHSQDVSDSLELVARVIADLQWEGRDAESFRQRFWSGLATSMLGLSDRLADERSELLRQAWAQEEASSSHGHGHGGVIGGGAGGDVAPARNGDDLSDGPSHSIASTPLDLHGTLFARLAELDAALRLGELAAIATLLRELGLADRIMLGSTGEPFAGHRLDPVHGLVSADGVQLRVSGEGAAGSGAGASGAANGASYVDGASAGIAGSGGSGASGGSAGGGGLGAGGAYGIASGSEASAEGAAPTASNDGVGGSSPAQLGEVPHPQAPEPRFGGSSPIGQPSMAAAFSVAGGLVAVGGAAAATAFAASALRRREASGR